MEQERRFTHEHHTREEQERGKDLAWAEPILCRTHGYHLPSSQCYHPQHDGREYDGDHGAGEHDAEGVRDWHVGDGGQGRDEGQGGHDALQQDQQLLTAWPG